jgi:hypothetical protein
VVLASHRLVLGVSFFSLDKQLSNSVGHHRVQRVREDGMDIASLEMEQLQASRTGVLVRLPSIRPAGSDCPSTPCRQLPVRLTMRLHREGGSVSIQSQCSLVYMKPRKYL